MNDTLAHRVATTLLAREGTGPAWGLELEDAGPGHARVRMRVRADMLNGHRIVHGGMIFALADSAFAYACNSGNVATVAQAASILFLAAAREDDTLIAEARQLSEEGRSGAYSIEVRTESGRVIAQMQGLSRTIGGPILNDEELVR